MKQNDVGTKVMQGGVVAALVAAPALGGQVVSAVAKKSDTVRGIASGDAGEFVVDLVGGAAVGAAEVAFVGATMGKANAKKAIPFAIAGALMGALLPILSKHVDAVVADILDTVPTPSVGGGTAPKLLPSPARALPGGISSNDAAGGVLLRRPGGIGRDPLNNPAGGVLTGF